MDGHVHIHECFSLVALLDAARKNFQSAARELALPWPCGMVLMLTETATADYFGNKNVGTNYGWVFTAYGIAGIAGPQVAGWFKDAAVGGDVGAWWTPFVIAAVSCFIAAVIGLMLKPVKRA